MAIKHAPQLTQVFSNNFKKLARTRIAGLYPGARGFNDTETIQLCELFRIEKEYVEYQARLEQADEIYDIPRWLRSGYRKMNDVETRRFIQSYHALLVRAEALMRADLHELETKEVSNRWLMLYQAALEKELNKESPRLRWKLVKIQTRLSERID